MSEVTIQKVMQIGWAAYEKEHPLPGYVRDAIGSILDCRTAKLGGHVQGCPDGHFKRQWYNSCKHRLCPQCAFIQIERWLDRQKARLLGTDHYHMIFTIPHELNELWLGNVRVMSNLLFTAVRDTLFDFMKDEKHVGGLPGIISSLHTWSQTLISHIHIHCLITGGGRDDCGRWQRPKRSTLLPYRAVMCKFRGKFLARLDKAIDKGFLELPEGMSRQRWSNLRNRLGRKVKWNVNVRSRYAHGNGVLVYLARYLRGGPMGNHRLVACENGRVKFTYRNNGEGGKKRGVMELPLSQFIQRYLLHVPVPRSQAVRYYGLYAPSKRAELGQCRAVLGQLPVGESEFLTWQDFCGRQGEEHPELCPECGKQLVRLEELPAARRKMEPRRRAAWQPPKFPMTTRRVVFC